MKGKKNDGPSGISVGHGAGLGQIAQLRHVVIKMTFFWIVMLSFFDI